MNFITALKRVTNPLKYISQSLVTNDNPPVLDERTKKGDIKIPPTRVTEAPDESSTYQGLSDKRLVSPDYDFRVITLIRKLAQTNQSVGQALNDIVTLANTGHKIEFDSDVDPDKADEMRRHIELSCKNWQQGIAGTHGLANKFISQTMISGSCVVEAVANLELDGIYRVLMPYPETIRFVYNKRTITYEPHQISHQPGLIGEFGLKKLNPNSFRFVGLNSDSEKPYPFIPYATALEGLADQKKMRANISNIMSQVGILGFLEVMVDKPEQVDMETDSRYKSRIEGYLQETKRNMERGVASGMVIGYKEDHEFEFHQTTQSASGVAEIFQQNQRLVNQGLKQDGALSGDVSEGAQAAITIIFTKILSQLVNVQLTVAEVLEFIYTLELRFAGFKFKTLKAVFKKSTIMDDLKLQQALEIKIRNLHQLLCDGIINLEQYAEKLDYEKPAEKEPVVPLNPIESTGDPNLDQQKKKVREKSKDTSDRRSRDRNKPQGTVKPK